MPTKRKAGGRKVLVGAGLFSGLAKFVRNTAKGALNIAKKTGLASKVALATGNPAAAAGLAAAGYGKRRRRQL